MDGWQGRGAGVEGGDVSDVSKFVEISGSDCVFVCEYVCLGTRFL
jgi:hypothetical protein